MDTIRAWTRQHENALRELRQTGCYRVREAYIREKNDSISEYYLALYDWYAAGAEKLVPRPAGAQYPIWLYLDDTAKLPPLPGTVVMELEIPRALVVVTDSDRWGYRVNDMYIPLDEADSRRHEEELRRYGIASETILMRTDKGNFYPLLRRKIAGSWDRVFDPPAVIGPTAQGTVWELREAWLRSVTGV
ncbi:MAG: DUF3841 domain-containing protein [Clostridia bacterium]|nr:DUF3841 domain-containing protein [Clostridia bacterium]